MANGLHDGAFNGVSGESYWLLRFEDKENAREIRQKNEQNSVSNEKYKIPDSFVESLREINKLKIEVDQTVFRLKDWQRQLYADWYKYMLMEYDFSLNEMTTEAHVNYVREYLAEELSRFDSEINRYEQNYRKINQDLNMLGQALNEINEQHPNSDDAYHASKAMFRAFMC